MFSIAETLKSGTVDELSARMSVSEQEEWKKFFEIKEKQRKKSQKKGESKGKRRTKRPMKVKRGQSRL